jgi:hypothetical protein
MDGGARKADSKMREKRIKEWAGIKRGTAERANPSTAASQNGQNDPHYHPEGASAVCG